VARAISRHKQAEPPLLCGSGVSRETLARWRAPSRLASLPQGRSEAAITSFGCATVHCQCQGGVSQGARRSSVGAALAAKGCEAPPETLARWSAPSRHASLPQGRAEAAIRSFAARQRAAGGGGMGSAGERNLDHQGWPLLRFAAVEGLIRLSPWAGSSQETPVNDAHDRRQ
jgi:hypothetical protein